MSIERHPNFHAVKFATDILVSYYSCLRGYAKPNTISIEQEVLDFVDNIENLVDNKVIEKNVPNKKGKKWNKDSCDGCPHKRVDCDGSNVEHNKHFPGDAE